MKSASRWFHYTDSSSCFCPIFLMYVIQICSYSFFQLGLIPPFSAYFSPSFRNYACGDFRLQITKLILTFYYYVMCSFVCLSILIIVCSVLCIVCSVLCIVCSVLCTVCSVLCIVCSVLCTVCSVLCIVSHCVVLCTVCV
jgi:hypothetical protein